MRPSQVLSVLVVLITASIVVACDGNRRNGISWYNAVYQNPSKHYLETSNLSDLPRKRLYCFIETSNLDSIKHSTFRLLSPVIFKPLELVLVPKESTGFLFGKDRRRYMVATSYLEDESVVEAVVKHLEKTSIVRTVDLSVDTVSFAGSGFKMVNDLTTEYAIKVLSRGIEKRSQ